MNVLITGVAGLYGVHLANLLLKKEDVTQVIGIDNFSREFLLDPLTFIRCSENSENGKFKFLKMDFRDLSPKLIDDLEVDVVIHLAALVSIDESMNNPVEYFEVNEIGTFKLCRSLFKSKRQPYLIYASSPEVYGNPIYTPMDVDHPLYPRSIYAVTKLAAEKHCHALYQWYRYPVAIIRNFNTYGENQNNGRYAAVIPTFITRALKGEDLILHWGGKQSRDFTYVKDAVRAYSILVAKREQCKGEIFNIGTGKQTSILELAMKIKKLTNSQSRIISKKGRFADLEKLEADISKTTEKLGWKPEYTLEEGLERTIKWYRRFVK